MAEDVCGGVVPAYALVLCCPSVFTASPSIDPPIKVRVAASGVAQVS